MRVKRVKSIWFSDPERTDEITFNVSRDEDIWFKVKRNFVFPAFSYYRRPDGVSFYLRPDGVSKYRRP